ncbi:MAG: hypothetical protein U0792_09175 [Gemmataceae bacterium]
MIYDLYDKLKSVTHGYGTMDYELLGFRAADLVKMDILVHGQKVDALANRAPFQRAERAVGGPSSRNSARRSTGTSSRLHSKQRSGRVIARENIAAMRKNVTAKCYGGDITRKRKLWAKQAEGKKRMKQIGQVEVPQEAFLAVLEQDE